MIQPPVTNGIKKDDGIIRIFALRHSQSELNHENIFCGWIDAGITEEGKVQARETQKTITEYCQSQGIELPSIGFTSRLVRTEQTIAIILKGLFKDKEFRNYVLENDLHHDSALRYVNKCTESGIIPVFNSWRLNERHYGSWQGRRKPDVLAEQGKESYMFVRRDYHGRPPPINLGLSMQTSDDVAMEKTGTFDGGTFKEPNRSIKYKDELSNGIELPYHESLCDVEKRLKPLLYDTILPMLKSYNRNGIIVGHGSSIRAILKLLQNLTEEEIRHVDIPNGIPLVIELNKENMGFLNRYYLDPEQAEINAADVRNQGFT